MARGKYRVSVDIIPSFETRFLAACKWAALLFEPDGKNILTGRLHYRHEFSAESTAEAETQAAAIKDRLNLFDDAITGETFTLDQWDFSRRLWKPPAG
jgi:hypothetical protein